MTIKVKDPQDLMRDNLIVKHYAGSRAYGTALPTSDTDFRGVFVADPVNVRTPFFPVREVEDVSEEDTKIYELSQFMKLTLDCNPNVIETLWTHPDTIVYTTPAYELLRKHAPDLLSSKIAFTTSGYAISQLKRIKGHSKWIMNPQPVEAPQQVDYVSLVHNFTGPKTFKLSLRDLKCEYRLVPFSGDTFGVYSVDGYSPFNSSTGNLNVDYDGDSHDLGTPLYVVKFNRMVYEAAKDTWKHYWDWKKNRNVARSELEEKFGYDCYTDDTEFLTNTGWKRFDEVLDTDNLATFNPLSQKLEYQAPMERIDGTYTGNLYHLTGYHVDTLVTSNHNMYVRPFSRTTKQEGAWGFERAAELSETFDTLNAIRPKLNRQLLPEGIDTTLFDHCCMLDYMRLVGWYVSDGTMQFDEDGGVKSMMISQSKPQSKLTQTLTKQINHGKIKCNTYVYEAQGIANYPERRWHFNKDLSTIIYKDCGHKSEHKRLPKWCFFLTKREMTTLVTALIQGDGTKKDHQAHTYVYYTVNKGLADDVQRLAFLCGFETSTYGPYTMDTLYNVSGRQMYQVHINMRPRSTRRHVRSASIKKVPVTNQRIVCFMVNNYTLVTRRNGHIGLHGNTKHAMHLVRLLRMGVEALEDGVINVFRPDAEELLSIRNGKWTYKEVVEYAEEMDNKVRTVLYPTTQLRKKPDIKLAAELILNVQDMMWTKN